jgi:hypothetical protein
VQLVKKEVPSGKTGKASLGRECFVSKAIFFEGKGKWKMGSQRTTNRQIMGDQGSQLGLV